MVTARRATSSPVAGTGTRVERWCSVMSPTELRIDSTGRSARPTPNQTSSPTPRVSTGTSTNTARSTARPAVLPSSSDRAISSQY